MTHHDVAHADATDPPLAGVRTLSTEDLKAALSKGLDDFWAMPTHAIFLCLIYPIVGLFIARFTFGYEVLPLLFPLAGGFALLGPFAAIGLYELSRRREHGLDTTWSHAFDVLRSPNLGAIVMLGFLMVAVFLIWIAVAQAIYISQFGYGPPASARSFIDRVFTTPEGWRLILIGNGVGLLFAVTAMTLTVMSVPMLIDRQVSAATAIATSIRVVVANPVVMAMWGLIVAAGLVVGSIPLFFGLAVVMPVLGHATWHLYRRAVNADMFAPHEYREPSATHRVAADFPVSLFKRERD
ncbi:hypothetical protein GJW-30_1_03262 [Variibacter gotjawalensis]|uniref:DUF2189 domain-containing protein n=1 Tax=Variibacter gotjawalensis TaxID=1333996 RepID=A0A0S3PXQ2_9BRAD|nr:putative membrane protein [Variibacter gotjawalensis]BAT60713.1 hypothetical protein GJW-30_1_03262 [Variibacter gotjawalensis]